MDQGITWARKKNSYYYLSELLNLKYLVLMRKNKHEEAERYLNLAQQMKMWKVAIFKNPQNCLKGLHHFLTFVLIKSTFEVSKIKKEG